MKMMKTLISLCALTAVLVLSACAAASHDKSSNGNTEVYGTVKGGIESSHTN